MSVRLYVKGRKRENRKSFVSCFAINFFHKNTMGKGSAPTLFQKENRRSAKSDVSKVLFPDIGKITRMTSDTRRWVEKVRE